MTDLDLEELARRLREGAQWEEDNDGLAADLLLEAADALEAWVVRDRELVAALEEIAGDEGITFHSPVWLQMRARLALAHLPERVP